jgi:hypothetical protein
MLLKDLSELHRSLQTASKQRKIAFWTRFCSEHEIVESAVPLFALSDESVSVKPYGSNQRPMLQRSSQMNKVVISEVQKVIDDFNSGSEKYEGLVYMMFWLDDNLVLPLYIGKAEKYGKNKNLSANIANIEKNHHFFCRWGYNYAYHIGDLSAAVCPGHPQRKGKAKSYQKYTKWAERGSPPMLVVSYYAKDAL